jgi:hypothetical protein
MNFRLPRLRSSLDPLITSAYKNHIYNLPVGTVLDTLLRKQMLCLADSASWPYQKDSPLSTPPTAVVGRFLTPTPDPGPRHQSCDPCKK